MCEPLGRRHGVALYSAETTFGTAVTPATAIGAGSIDWTKVNNNRYVRTLGSANHVAVKGGEAYTEWTIGMPDGVQTGAKTFLLKAQRASGVLPSFTLGFGYQDDDSPVNKSADQITGCKINTMELGLQAGPDGFGPLTASFSGFGQVPTNLTSLVPAVLTTTPWVAYEAAFTKGGSAYPLRGFTLTLDNGLSRDYVIPGATPASNLRGPTYITEHDQTISGTLTRNCASGVDVQADCPTAFAMVLVLTNECDATALTLTFADVLFENENATFDESGYSVTIPYTAKTLAIT